MATLLAIDTPAERPVSTMGWVYGTYTHDTFFKIHVGGVIEGGFAGFVDMYHQAAQFRDYLERADTVVCEKYVPFKAMADPSPLLAEGAIRLLRPDVVLQPASGKNTLVPDSFLKGLGQWSTEGHHNDAREALRHAYVYLATHNHLPTIRALSGR